MQLQPLMTGVHLMQVYLALYTAESYPRTARKLGIWPFPRGHHRFVTRLPTKGAMLLLADKRFCPLLPDQLRVKPKEGLMALPAAQHESCSVACGYASLRSHSMCVKGQGRQTARKPCLPLFADAGVLPLCVL